MSEQNVLLAAEADQIQDLLFRAEQLRDVSGGSHELERFWSRAAQALQPTDERSPTVEIDGVTLSVLPRVLAQAGGALRLWLDGRDAVRAGEVISRWLADAYAEQFGGRLTTATVLHGGDGAEGLDRLQEELRRRKDGGDPPAVSAHLPYIHLCDSCGREAAEVQSDVDRTRVLCRTCGTRQHSAGTARRKFIQSPGDGTATPPPDEVSEVAPPSDLPHDADAVGAYDPRSMVAYLLADGNDFGSRFSSFDPFSSEGPARLHDFSNEVARAGGAALRAAAVGLYRESRKKRPGVLPVMPLILGGDDIFALLPARWAFWFADRFAREFESVVNQAWSLSGGQPTPPLTVSCALVFCKAKFPYQIAHAVGAMAMKQVKAVARRHATTSLVRGVEARGTVAGELVGPRAEYGVFATGGYAGGGPDAGADPAPTAAGTEVHPVCHLFGARRDLGEARLPATRRAALERLFEDPDRGKPEWTAQVERLVARSGVTESLSDWLARLGDARTKRLLGSSPLDARSRDRSGISDLLHLWSYLEIPEGAEINPLVQEVVR